MTIEGKVADKGDGKVKVETKTKTKVEDGDDKETQNQVGDARRYGWGAVPRREVGEDDRRNLPLDHED